MYLGSAILTSVNIDSDVDKRQSQSTFGRLRASVWDRRGIKLKTKLKMYKAVVLPTLLYAFETCTVYERHSKTTQSLPPQKTVEGNLEGQSSGHRCS